MEILNADNQAARALAEKEYFAGRQLAFLHA